MANELPPVKVYDSPEEAHAAAREEAEAAGVSPSAVMHSAPDGYGTGEDAIAITEEGQVVDVDDEVDEDPESMTVAEIKAELDRRHIEYKSSAKKHELVELLEDAD